MNSMNNIDSKKMAALLAMASKKLGTTPDALKSQLESGKFDKALSSLPKGHQEKLKRALSDKNSAQQLLSDPRAQEIYKKLQK